MRHAAEVITGNPAALQVRVLMIMMVLMIMRVLMTMRVMIVMMVMIDEDFDGHHRLHISKMITSDLSLPTTKSQ